MLDLFAEHAATALDILTVLTEAERSNVTARTLPPSSNRCRGSPRSVSWSSSWRTRCRR